MVLLPPPIRSGTSHECAWRPFGVVRSGLGPVTSVTTCGMVAGGCFFAPRYLSPTQPIVYVTVLDSASCEQNKKDLSGCQDILFIFFRKKLVDINKIKNYYLAIKHFKRRQSMAIKLNTEKIMQYLKADDRSIAWLARKVGISPELMQYRLKNQVPNDADLIAFCIDEPDPKNLLIVE